MSDPISSMTELVTQSRLLIDTFNGKNQSINDAVQTAIDTLPALDRAAFVDEVNGNDANDGLTKAKPLRTVAKAIALGGAGRAVNIALLSDVTLTERIDLKVNQSIRVYSYGYVYGDPTAAPRRKLNLAIVPSSDGTADLVAGFYTAAWGSNTLHLQTVEVVYPMAPIGRTMGADQYCGLVSGNGNAGPSLIGIQLTDCKLTHPVGTVGVVSGVRTHALALDVRNTTYVAAEMAGKWIADIAAGTAVPVVGKNFIITNLTTL